MGFFDSLKSFKNQIDQIESSVYSGKQSLLEVYERNAKLEAEIAVRTRELDTANRQMLTLQHVWDMMNSSKPLSSVLNAIARSLQGELGYLNTCIPKRMVDDKGVYMQLVSFSGELFGSSFLKFFNCEPSDLRLEFPKAENIVNAIDSNSIYQSTDIYQLIKEVCAVLPHNSTYLAHIESFPPAPASETPQNNVQSFPQYCPYMAL